MRWTFRSRGPAPRSSQPHRPRTACGRQADAGAAAIVRRSARSGRRTGGRGSVGWRRPPRPWWFMIKVFGQIPIGDALVARYTPDICSSRVYSVKYVLSLGVASLAVPTIAMVYRFRRRPDDLVPGARLGLGGHHDCGADAAGPPASDGGGSGGIGRTRSGPGGRRPLSSLWLPGGAPPSGTTMPSVIPVACGLSSTSDPRRAL
jgi:hypothetical protein